MSISSPATNTALRPWVGVPSKIMVDNLKSAVLQRLAGAAPVFNPRYLDFARHHGFAIEACNVARGNEKGRVESGVGYVKKNFLRGLELTDFSTINAAAQVWLDTVANVRIHGETQQRPVDLLAQERPRLGRLNPHPYDIALTSTSVASSQFRITLDTNQYSVPAAYAHRRLLADRVERGGHGRNVSGVDAVDFDQVQHHTHPPDGAKAKYRGRRASVAKYRGRRASVQNCSSSKLICGQNCSLGNFYLWFLMQDSI